MHIVLLEDCPLYRQAMATFLRARQRDRQLLACTLHAFGNVAAAIRAARELPAAVVVVDVHMHGKHLGIDSIGDLRAAAGSAPIVMHSVLTDAAVIVKAMQAGASDYVPKNLGFAHLFAVLSRCAPSSLRVERASRPQAAPTEAQAAPGPLRTMVGHSEAMRSLRGQIARCRGSGGNVLIYGEAGTGKELVARALADPEGPFVAVDAATLDDTLASSLLFGACRGAYTGADRDRPGLFEQANEGTLYIDEIANLSLGVQAKLLRALQEREVSRLGCSKRRPTHFRFLAATNVDLQHACRMGRFRYDLLTRLQVFVLEVPPLRARRDDIEPLFDHFVQAERLIGDQQYHPEIWSALRARPWHGNVRELANAAVVAVANANAAPISAHHLPASYPCPVPQYGAANVDTEQRSEAEGPHLAGEPYAVAPTHGSVRAIQSERAALDAAYAAAGGNVSRMARTLRVDRSHLHAKLTRMGIHAAREAP